MGTLLITVAAALTQARRLTVDGFFNLYAGRWIAEHGIPSHDPLTIAGQGRPWLDQQWLAHVAYYASWQVGGYAAVALVCALAAAAGFGMLFRLLRGLGASALASCLWSIAALLASLSSVTPRAQVFGFPLFVALLFWLLAGDRSAQRWQRWWVVPLVVLWGNVHGSVLLAVALVVSRSLVDAFHAARARHPRAAVLHCPRRAPSPPPARPLPLPLTPLTGVSASRSRPLRASPHREAPPWRRLLYTSLTASVLSVIG